MKPKNSSCRCSWSAVVAVKDSLLILSHTLFVWFFLPVPNPPSAFQFLPFMPIFLFISLSTPPASPSPLKGWHPFLQFLNDILIVTHKGSVTSFQTCSWQMPAIYCSHSTLFCVSQVGLGWLSIKWRVSKTVYGSNIASVKWLVKMSLPCLLEPANAVQLRGAASGLAWATYGITLPGRHFTFVLCCKQCKAASCIC